MTVIAALLMIGASVEYVALEAVSASGWKSPAYSYATNFISDLGVAECGPLDGREVCSPRHDLMNAAFILYGLLFASGGLLLSRAMQGMQRTAYALVALTDGVGMVLLGLFHEGLPFHFIGAAMAIISGNAASIVLSTQRKALSLPKWFGPMSATLGLLGLACARAATRMVDTPIRGIPERGSVYTVMAVQLIAGLALLAGRSQGLKP